MRSILGGTPATFDLRQLVEPHLLRHFTSSKVKMHKNLSRPYSDLSMYLLEYQLRSPSQKSDTWPSKMHSSMMGEHTNFDDHRSHIKPHKVHKSVHKI